MEVMKLCASICQISLCVDAGLLQYNQAVRMCIVCAQQVIKIISNRKQWSLLTDMVCNRIPSPPWFQHETYINKVGGN